MKPITPSATDSRTGRGQPAPIDDAGLPDGRAAVPAQNALHGAAVPAHDALHGATVPAHDALQGAAAAPQRDVVAQARRWYWQRVSAMVLAVCVLVHLVVIVYAVRGGLSAAEILGRTRGNWGFAAFYAVFVVACAVHVPLGIANIAREWAGFSERAALWFARAVALLLLVLGLRAVLAVTLA